MLVKRMQDALNDQINYEFYSAFIYLSMSARFAALGLPGGANWMNVQYQEELAHAMKLFSYVTERGGKTFFWKGRYGEDPNDRENVVTDLNCFERFSPRLAAPHRSTRWLFLANMDPDIQADILGQVEGKPFVGCDTQTFWIERKLESLRRVIGRVDALFVNDREARELSGRRNLMLAASEILKMGPKVLVLKKGEHGAFLFTKDFRFFAPAYPLSEVLDPTGAGDSFAGGFMGYLASAPAVDERHLRRAMIYGTITGSFACETFSVERLRGLTDEHISKRFGELVDLVKIEID